MWEPYTYLGKIIISHLDSIWAGPFICSDGSPARNCILNKAIVIDTFWWSLFETGPYCNTWNIGENWLQGWWRNCQWGLLTHFFPLFLLLPTLMLILLNVETAAFLSIVDQSNARDLEFEEAWRYCF